MIRALVELLRECGYEPPPGRDVRDHMTLVKNTGAIPVSARWVPGIVPRGFQIALFGAKGPPTHYARCQAAIDADFARECALVDQLVAVDGIREWIPSYRTAADDVIRVQVSEFVPGELHASFAMSQKPTQWLETARQLMDARRAMVSRAEQALPGLQRGPVTLVDEARAHFPVLRENGVPDEVLSTVESALSGVAPLGAELQHGDFWSRNIIGRAGRWRIIDFERFGLVRAPLYDVFHFVQSAVRARSESREARWFGPGSRGAWGAWPPAWRALIDEESGRVGADPSAAGALLLHYLVDIAAYRVRPGVPAQFSRLPVGDLIRAGETLQAGYALAELLPG